MENKQAKQSASKASHPTVLGALFFTLFNLILLGMLSWVLLEIWFSVQAIFLHNGNTNQTVNNILSNNIEMITRYHSQYSDRALNIFHKIQNRLHSWFDGHIGNNIVEMFIGITEIILTRLFLFIEFIPFMIMIVGVLIVDGLVERDKRKFQGARESTFLFHRLKPLAKVSFFSLFLTYMVFPHSFSPELFLIPMVVLSSLFTMLSIKSFKKYL